MRRDHLVEAARTWVGTPYHHMARVKGQGVDCGQLIIGAFVDAGAVPDFQTGFYTMDWHLHRGEERYLGFIEDHLRRDDDVELSIDARIANDRTYALPAGDVVVFRVGRCFSHGGIVSQWPFFIHSYLPSGIVEEIDLRNTPMSARSCRVYTFEGYER